MINFYGYHLINLKNKPVVLDCNDIKYINPNEDMTDIYMKDGTTHFIGIESEILANVWVNYQNSTNKYNAIQSDYIKLNGAKIKLINQHTGKRELVYFSDIESAGCKDNDESNEQYLYERTTIKLFNGTQYYIDIHAHFIIKIWKALTDNKVYYGIRSIDPFSKPLKITQYNDLVTEDYDELIDFANAFYTDEDEGCTLHMSLIPNDEAIY